MYTNDYYENSKKNKIFFIIIIAILFVLGVVFLMIRIPNKNLKDNKKDNIKVEKQGSIDSKDKDVKENKENKENDEEKVDNKTEETTVEDNSTEVDTSNEEKKEVKQPSKPSSKGKTTVSSKKIYSTTRRQSGVIAVVKTYKKAR